MSASVRRIFVSYRRDDCAAHAGWLASMLRATGAGDVFIDVESIGLGENFVTRIQREIEACDVVLVVIGKEWLTLTGHDGGPRIRDELDWVHLEVKSALKRGIPVVPILVEGATMPRPEELPEQVRDLAYRNGIRLTEASWAADVGRLVDLLPPASRVPSSVHDGGPPAAPLRPSPTTPRAQSTVHDVDDTVIVAASSAYAEYLEQSAYVCQPGRSFRQVEHMGFYTGRELKREIAVVLHRRDDVTWSREHAEELRRRGEPYDDVVAALIEKQWDPHSILRGRRREGDPYMVFCLTGPADPQTLVMRQAVAHVGRSGWTQGQRYASFDALSRSPSTTDEL